MVKSRKLWREIELQYAKLQEDEAAASSLAQCSPEIPQVRSEAAPGIRKEATVPLFYRGGLQKKHWVLTCCAMMVACEWVDRSVLSIAMQSIKEEFNLNDTEVGLMASASLWLVPFATGPLGRLADLLPRAKLLSAGVFGWAVCTFATGSARSFLMIMLARLLAGLANCAGFPVAVSLMSDHFESEELTTAMGYFSVGMAIGGLLGFAVGGTLVTQAGWRWAFWAVGSPQLIVSLLFFFTVPEGKGKAKPEQSWSADVGELLTARSVRLLMTGSLLTGLCSGQGRFLSALAERKHGVEPERIGLVMGPILGLTGVLAAWLGGHFVDHCFAKTGDARVNLWLAAVADMLSIIAGSCSVLAHSFPLLVVFAAFGVAASSLRNGVQAVIQMLSTGRRGTMQGVLETCWSLGMGLGPLLAGGISDVFESSDCDDACGLTRSMLLFGCVGVGARGATYFAASISLRADVEDMDKRRASTQSVNTGIEDFDATPADKDSCEVDQTHKSSPEASIIGNKL